MSYRSEEEALRGRVAELEGELESAEATIARLRGDGAAEVAAPDEVDRFTGIRTNLFIERELPFAMTDAGLVAISDLLEKRFPGGTTTQIGTTFTHRKASYELRIEALEGGGSRLRVKGDYRPARTQLGLGTPGLAFLGAVITAGMFAALRTGPAGIAVGVVLGALGGFWFLRNLLQRAMAKDRQRITAAFESVAELARLHRDKDERRIETHADVDAEAEQEAAALEAAELEAAALEEAELSRRR